MLMCLLCSSHRWKEEKRTARGKEEVEKKKMLLKGKDVFQHKTLFISGKMKMSVRMRYGTLEHMVDYADTYEYYSIMLLLLLLGADV